VTRFEEMFNRPSAGQVAAESAFAGGAVACPGCGCQDLRIYRTAQGDQRTLRYKVCRNCGHRILTASETTERIVRDVTPHILNKDG
jgi:DNA-directed RNA polymerase subunit RPC12/RpoP